MALSLGIVLPACGEDEGGDDTTSTVTTTPGDTTGDTTGDGDGDTTDTTGSDDTTDTTGGDGDGDTTGGDGDSCEPYGNPGPMGTDCCEGEMPIGVMGIEGGFCSPACDGTTCPAVDGLMAQCALTTDGGMTPTNCAVICNAAGDSSDCPTGATCKDVMQMGAGICTYP
jgi:hypothetical protein